MLGRVLRKKTKSAPAAKERIGRRFFEVLWFQQLHVLFAKRHHDNLIRHQDTPLVEALRRALSRTVLDTFGEDAVLGSCPIFWEPKVRKLILKPILYHGGDSRVASFGRFEFVPEESEQDLHCQFCLFLAPRGFQVQHTPEEFVALFETYLSFA